MACYTFTHNYSNNCHPYSTYLNLSSEALTVAGSPAPSHAPSTTHQGSMVSLHLQTSCTGVGSFWSHLYLQPSLTGVGGCLSHCTPSPASQGWAVTGLTAHPAQLLRGGRLLVSLHPQPSCTGMGGYWAHCTPAQLHRGRRLLISLHSQPSCSGVSVYWSPCTPSPAAQGWVAIGLTAPPAQLHRGERLHLKERQAVGIQVRGVHI